MEASRAAPTRRNRKSLRQRTALRLAPEADPTFEQLYERHAREVYQYALALLTNPADAEDVTQTTFMNAYRAYQSGERPRRPHNWLIAITHNVCRMRWRQASHRPLEVPLEEAREPVALEQERPNLDEVLHALARLSFNQRAALVMRELEGRSYREIAGTLGLSTGAVEALIFRARRNLQLRRRALGVLTTAPLPGSLSTLLGGGGGAVVAGGAAIGADVVLKAAAILAAGALTAGAGYESVKTLSNPSRAQADARLAPAQISRPAAAPTRAAALRSKLALRAKARPALRRAIATRSAARIAVRPQPGAASAPQPAAGAAPVAQTATEELAAAAGATTAAAPAPVAVPPAPVAVPPAPVAVLPAPVAAPPATIPAAPALPVTVPKPAPALPVTVPPVVVQTPVVVEKPDLPLPPIK